MVGKLSSKVFWKDPSRLLTALRLLTHLSFRLQFFYGSERYYLVHEGAPCLQTEESFLVMDVGAVTAIDNIYQVLRPLHFAVHKYLNSDGRETQLDTAIIPFLKGLIFERKKAYRCARREYVAEVCIGQNFEMRNDLCRIAIKAIAEEGLSRCHDRQNSPFVGRKGLCKEIKTHLPQNSNNNDIQIVALTGMKGIGKTRLAIEYAVQEFDRYEFVWFIDASNNESRERSLNDLAEGLTIASPIEDNVEQKLFNWLEQRAKRWLLIFDNAMTPKAALPKTGGDIIITSLRTDWKVRIELTPLHESDAITLLENITKNKNPDEAALLVKQLGCMPSDLVIAGSTISKDRVSYRKYLKK